MGLKLRLPPIDARSLAAAFLQAAMQGQRDEVRITVPAANLRKLAWKRIAVALGLFLIFLMGGGVFFFSGALAPGTLLCGVFASLFLGIAARERAAIRSSADLEVTVRGDQLHVEGQAPRTIRLAMDRPDHLRLVLKDSPFAALWPLSSGVPYACVDLPSSPESRLELYSALRYDGVTVWREGSKRRGLFVAAGLTWVLLKLTVARPILEQVTLLAVLSPLLWAFLELLGLTFRRRWQRRTPRSPSFNTREK